jgi:hypothetical protein
MPRKVDLELEDQAYAWRYGLLMRGGMASPVARAVAHDPRFDVHEILGLLERGCPPSLAIEIVAPVEDRRIP